MELKNWFKTTALAAAICGPMAASAVTVDGIVFNPNPIIERVEIFEAERFGDANGNDNGLLDVPGEELVGIGRVLTIRDFPAGASTWENGDNGRELTVYIYGYTLEATTPTVSGAQQTFTGGRVDIYSDTNQDFDPTGTQAAGIATATNGNLWLSLEGSPIGGDGVLTTDPLTLLVDIFGFGLGGAGSVFVTGGGLLDVVGGSAAEYFDTNTFGCSVGPNCPDDADKTFTSSGQADGAFLPSGDAWGFEGTIEVRDVAQPIPEPMTTALMGLGLVGMGIARRKRS